MKLATFTAAGSTRIGVVVDDQVIDLSQAAPELPVDMVGLLELGADGFDAAAKAASRGVGAMPLDSVRLEAPVRPRKFMVIGRNYHTYQPKTEAAPDDEVTAARLNFPVKHFADVDAMKAAGHQLWVTKQVTAVTGPFDTILLPKVSDNVIYENEVALVIGKRCRYVPREDAQSVIAGYMVCNDVSTTDWAAFSPSYTLGKSFDTHGPIGPWIVTRDEIDDPQALEMRVYISGELDQVGNTADMEADYSAQIAYLSQAMTLEPGDVLATGQPASPQRFLREGDVVRCEIDQIGYIENPVAKER